MAEAFGRPGGFPGSGRGAQKPLDELGLGLELGLDWGPEPPRTFFLALRSLSWGFAAGLPAGFFLSM